MIRITQRNAEQKIIESETWHKHYTRRPSANYTYTLFFYSLHNISILYLF